MTHSPSRGNLVTFRFSYDFGVHGGAVGTTVLTPANGKLPDNFVISQWLIEPIAALNSAAASLVSIGVSENSTLFTNALAFNAAGFGIGGSLGSVINVKLTQANDVTLIIDAFALTAGSLNVWVSGVQGS